MRILISGDTVPEQLDVTFVKLSENLNEALEANPKKPGMEVKMDLIHIESTEVGDRDMGENWTGYVVLRDPNEYDSVFMIPVFIPMESSKYTVEIPELHIITSLVGTPQKTPRFRAGAVSDYDEEISLHLSEMINTNEGLTLDSLVKRVDISDGNIQAQIRLKTPPDLIEIEYSDILLNAERRFLENPSNPFPVALTPRLELESCTINPEWAESQWSNLDVYVTFLAARKKVFDFIRKDRPFPLLDLTRLESEIMEYVSAYGELLTSPAVFSEVDLKVKPPLGVLQFIDCIFVGDETGEYPFVLMSPLHPLKLLYHLVFQKKMNEIVGDIIIQDGQKVLSFSSGDINRLGHSDYPDLLTYFTQTTQRVFRCAGNARYYWSVFVDSNFPSF